MEINIYTYIIVHNVAENMYLVQSVPSEHSSLLQKSESGREDIHLHFPRTLEQR